MKYAIYLSAAILGLLGLMTVTFYEQNSEAQTLISTSLTQSEISQNNQTPPQIEPLNFTFTIESSAADSHGNRLGSSQLNAELSLNQQSGSKLWLGQINNIRLNSEQLQLKQHQILFTTEYNGLEFSQIDLLGLEATHPLQSIRFLLEQLSYRLDRPLEITQANGSTVYQYTQYHNNINRRVIKQTQSEAKLDIQLVKSGEAWLLTLNQDLPASLNYSNSQQYQTAQGIMTLRQKVTLERTDKAPHWHGLAFVNGANEHIHNPNKAQHINKINSQQQLLKVLAELAQSSDKSQAIAIGQYLLEHYDSNALAELINNQADDTKLASLLIYSVQKAGGFAAEVMLAELFEHPYLSQLNKRRVLISMGRFEDASSQTLTALKQFSQNDDRSLADTALLAIGSLAKFSKAHKHQVEDYLAQVLKQPQKQAYAIIAIKNSGSSKFNQQVEALLDTPQQNVQIAAIKLLAKYGEHQDRLIDHTTQSGDIRAISTLQVALSGSGRSLTGKQKAKITQAIENAEHPVLKKQLTALLNIEENYWDKAD